MLDTSATLKLKKKKKVRNVFSQTIVFIDFN